MFFKRQTEGSVICASCGVLVGVNDETCYNCGRRNPGLWGYGPALRRLGQDLGFVAVVVGSTITLYVISLLLSGAAMGAMLSPSFEVLFLLGMSGTVPVLTFGRWWTLFTAGWLHGGLLHIFFSVLWIRQLAPAVADLYGAGRMVIIYVLSGACGFALSTFAGVFMASAPIFFLRAGQSTVGASAPIFGLLGAVVCYGHRTGTSHTAQAGLQYALFMGIFGLIMPGIDNYAHLGGFAGGYLTALILDPTKPERVNHLLGAVICLALTLVAFIASFVTALPMLLRN